MDIFVHKVPYTDAIRACRITMARVLHGVHPYELIDSIRSTQHNMCALWVNSVVSRPVAHHMCIVTLKWRCAAQNTSVCGDGGELRSRNSRAGRVAT
jgi:hypothetical protein